VSEHTEQCLVIAWAALHEERYPELRTLHAVQNWAGVKGPAEGARRKREGVKAGVPDLHLPVPRGPYSSLYIEMKNPGRGGKGKAYPTAEQRAWHEMLRLYTNAVVVCWTAEEAQRVVLDYLEGRLAP